VAHGSAPLLYSSTHTPVPSLLCTSRFLSFLPLMATSSEKTATAGAVAALLHAIVATHRIV
jgi:hypothetical protein